MESHSPFGSSRGSAKLPPHLPPPSSSSSNSVSPTPGANKYTTIERKSIVRMTSNGPIDDANGDDCFVRRSSSNSSRRPNIPLQHREDMNLLDFGSHSHISQILDRIDSLSLSNLHQIASRPFSQRSSGAWRPSLSSQSSPVQNNSTSGYDSNSSSSLLSGYFYPLGSSGASVSNSTIRRIPSVPNLRPSSAASSSVASSSGSSQCTNSVKSPGKAPPSGSRKARPNSMHIGKQFTLKDDVIKATDKIEKRVAFLREVAQELLAERNKLENAIEQVKQCCTESHFSNVELEEIFAAVGLLERRLQTVSIEVRTPRSSEQAEALNRANKYIDELRKLLQNNPKSTNNSSASSFDAGAGPGKQTDKASLSPHLRFARQRCLSYISSCSSDGIPETPATPIDEKFQSTVIECTAEDQKQIRRTLEAILAQLNQNDKS